MRETGIVKWFNDAKEYGFIIPDNGGQHLLANTKQIVGRKYLLENERVTFIRVNGALGLEATSITVVNEIKHLALPRISVFENLVPVDVCADIVRRYKEATMNPNSGTQSRKESYAQVTELVENRGISWEMNPYDYDLLATAITQSAGVPYQHIEAIDIYNYEEGQFLDLHHDYPYDPRQINYYKHGGDRVGTGIFYLNDDFEGGETYFPKYDVTIKPKIGSFLYFQQNYDEETNWSTIHESKLITKGTKWIASCFFSDQPRVGYSPRPDELR